MPHPIIALLPAHDEADILICTLSNLRAAQPPPDTIIVIADHCTDSTVRVAEQEGAVVFRRDDGEPGKGHALRWLFAQNPSPLPASAIVAIFDADSQVSANFFADTRQCFERGARAAQGFIQPTADVSPEASLAAYSEVLSQVIDDASRARLGWSVPLRGTGMAFRTDLLRELLPQVHTRTEDVELSLLLAERGERVIWMPRAVVYDPKPPDAERASRQRARWLQGQVQVWQDYGPRIAQILFRGPAVWWLFAALLMKPKTLFVTLKVLACAVALAFPAPLWLRVALSLLVAAEVAYYIAGLCLVPRADRARYARALLRAPIYLWVWARGVMTAVRARSEWLSARR